MDFEPNDAVGATSIEGTVNGVDVRRHGDIPGIESSSYAVAAGGYSDATKAAILVEGLTGDNLRMTIRNAADVVVRDSTSDIMTSADFPGSANVTFVDNINIERR